MSKPKILAAIDIGSHTTYAALADVSTQELRFLSLLKIQSKGVKKGMVTNIQSVQNLVSQVVEALQQDCKYQIHTVIVSISDVSVIGFNIVGKTDLKGRQITKHHIHQSIANTYEIARNEDRKIIHLLKQTFAVDAQSNMDNPVGLMGDKLRFYSHVISVSNSAYFNLSQVFSHTDINIDRVVSSGFASAISAATEEERQLGVCVLDIGADTTDIVIFSNGVVIHTDVVAFGGNMINNDIIYYSKVGQEDLERIKTKIDISKDYDAQDSFNILSLSNQHKEVSKKALVEVISARCEELISEVKKSINRSGYENSFPAGFVLCGGVANLNGLDDFVYHQTKQSVRKSSLEISLPNGEKYEQTCFATLCGLFIASDYASETITMTNEDKKSIMSRFKSLFVNKINKLFS